jgi:phage I-like protein
VTPARHICLSSAERGSVRFLSGLNLRLADGATRSTVTVTRTGQFRDPRYGEFEITRDMLLAMVENFEKGTYGQDIFIDVDHKPGNGAAGKIIGLSVEGNRLRAQVEWTPYGVEAITGRGYAYLSAEYHENWRDNERGLQHGPLLLGAALTVRPVIKRLDPVRLSEGSDDIPILIHPELATTLAEETRMKLQELLALLKQKLQSFKLSEAAVTSLCNAYETAGKALGDDETALKAAMAQFEAAGKTLSESADPGKPIEIKIDIPAGKTLSESDITRILDEREQKRTDDARKLAETREQRVKQFTDLLDGNAGLKELSETQRKELAQAAELITADMTEAQVKALAEHQIRIGNQMVIHAKLLAQGYRGPQGTVHISVDDSNAIKSLQEKVDQRLGFADMPESRRFANTGGKLQAANRALAEKVLAEYDRLHAADLHHEHKQLAAGDGLVSDVSVPSVFERTVIREAMYSLVGLQFVDSGTAQFASSIVIPYSYRDTTAAGLSSTRKYEGQAIARAGVVQTSETAYPIPQKLAFEVSDELRYLTAGSLYNWEAVGENQRNASRIIGEDLERLIFNEVLNAADEYGATTVSNENLELQADDAKKVFVLAHFPVVHPRKVYDLQGAQVGSTTNAITVSYDSVARSEYDGTGTQANGIYYVLDYNLGEIYLVDEAGVIQTPANGTAYTISYSYATNVYAFDIDEGVDETDAHWDKFLYRYGLRKSVIEDQRYHMANFGLMSGTVMTQIEQAKQFGANSMRAGTDLSADGNLGRVKDVPNFKTSAPGLWMGDQRIIVGERGQTRLRMAKPWTMGELENQKDSNGRFTGKKEAYGDQFLFLHTPTQLKRAYTSIVLYSSSGRGARTAP